MPPLRVALPRGVLVVLSVKVTLPVGLFALAVAVHLRQLKPAGRLDVVRVGRLFTLLGVTAFSISSIFTL